MKYTDSFFSVNKQSYMTPCFTDRDRLSRIQAALPSVDNMYKEYCDKYHAPGYAFGIVLDDKLIHTGSGGFIDLAQKKQASSKSMFRIASMVKSFTAMSILILRDEGKLKLDDPIYAYIPELQEQKITVDSPAITIRDLLTHSAGFSSDNYWADRNLDETEKELIHTISKGIFFSNAPGNIYEYSNLGYALLGSIINKVAGMPYEDFIAEQIWQTIGMKDAFWDFTKVPPSQLVHGYSWVDNNWKEEKLLKNGIFGASGGIITSIDSFSQYVALHLSAWPPRDEKERKPLKRSSLREMSRPWIFRSLVPFKFPNGRECVLSNAYGYGLTWTQDDKGRVFARHSGGLPGFGCNWCIMPDYGIGVILLTNVTYAPAAEVNLYVLDKILEESKINPRQTPPLPILKEKQNYLIQLLPNWEHAIDSKNFAANFFQDHSIDALKNQTNIFFEKAGKIVSIGEVLSKRPLSGHFIIKCERSDIKIAFSLTPTHPPLIQEYHIELINFNPPG